MTNGTQITNNASFCTLKEHLDSTLMQFSVEKIHVSDPSELFGESAKYTEPINDILTTAPTIDNQIFMFATILIAMIVFNIMILLFRKPIWQILSIMFSSNFNNKQDQLYNTNLERVLNYNYFLTLPVTILCVSIILFNSFMPLHGIKLLYYVGVAALLFAFYLFKRIILDIVGYITNNKELRARIIYISKLLSVLPALLLLPASLIISFADMSNPHIYYPIIAILLTLLINYTITLYSFFKSFSISFFQYILYLCTVEIVPISFIFIFLYRNSANIF